LLLSHIIVLFFLHKINRSQGPAKVEKSTLHARHRRSIHSRSIGIARHRQYIHSRSIDTASYTCVHNLYTVIAQT